MTTAKAVTILVATAVLVSLLIACLATCGGAQPSSAPNVAPGAAVGAEAAPKAVEEITTVDLSGKWTADLNGTTFNVDIDNTSVTIKMTKNGTSLLYWYGTFSNRASIGEVVTSNKIDINKAVMSGAASKAFMVQKGHLAFDVSAMGQTKTVEVTHA